MTQYYVATTGNDSNPGTSGSPFLTIGHAASVVVAGDTVNVGPGTYAETLTFREPEATLEFRSPVGTLEFRDPQAVLVFHSLSSRSENEKKGEPPCY